MRNVFVFCAAIALASMTACGGGGDKCEKAVDKAMGAAMEMMEGMAKMGGDEAQAKKMIEEAKAEMAKAKPEAIKKCKEEVAKNKDLEKALDCIIASKDIQAMQKCEGAEKLMK